jgi:hypothetical protein
MANAPSADELTLLAARIHEKRCVAFLGAGVNVSSIEHQYEGLPLGAEIAQQLIGRLGIENAQFNEPLYLPRIAFLYEQLKDRSELIAAVESLLADLEREPSPVLKLIAELPFRLIVTTNYDRLIERALEETGRDFRVIVQPSLQDTNMETFKHDLATLVETYQGVILYKMHGSFPYPVDQDQTAPSATPILITEEDYIYVLASQERGFPNELASLISGNTLIFLGYSLEDWDFRAILKNLPTEPQQKWFAVLKDPAEWWVQFWAKQNLALYDMDIYEFAKQIEKSYQEQYGHEDGKSLDDYHFTPTSISE